MWTSLCDLLPEPLGGCLRRVPPSVQSRTHEVRLRSGRPLMLTTVDGHVTLGAAVTPTLIRECFLRCCGHAVHTHQAELSQGFVTTAQGLRVGVAGTAVLKEGEVTSCRELTALCIRLPRVITGCAAPLLPHLDDDGRIRGMLLCGAPASGKTTLLRDLAAELSCHRAVAVVDERCEIAVCGVCDGCDVLRGYPKGDGVLQAVRTLAPDVVIADELGTVQEWAAVTRSACLGAAVIASAHVASLATIRKHELLLDALRSGAFERVVILPPRQSTSREAVVVKARDILEDTGCVIARVRLDRDRCARGMGLVP